MTTDDWKNCLIFILNNMVWLLLLTYTYYLQEKKFNIKLRNLKNYVIESDTQLNNDSHSCDYDIMKKLDIFETSSSFSKLELKGHIQALNKRLDEFELSVDAYEEAEAEAEGARTLKLPNYKPYFD